MGSFRCLCIRNASGSLLKSPSFSEGSLLIWDHFWPLQEKAAAHHRTNILGKFCNCHFGYGRMAFNLQPETPILHSAQVKFLFRSFGAGEFGPKKVRRLRRRPQEEGCVGPALPLSPVSSPLIHPCGGLPYASMTLGEPYEELCVEPGGGGANSTPTRKAPSAAHVLV